MNTKKLTCINCPMGCSIEADYDENGITVRGNSCKRGEEYAKSEITNPKRTVTSTVRVINGERAVVSVKTACDIPKNMIFNVMNEINKKECTSPIMIGDVIIKNVLNTNVDVVATCNSRKI